MQIKCYAMIWQNIVIECICGLGCVRACGNAVGGDDWGRLPMVDVIWRTVYIFERSRSFAFRRQFLGEGLVTLGEDTFAKCGRSAAVTELCDLGDIGDWGLLP